MFRFKQFTIQQDRTAMKVCTDACVLGAWADVGQGGRLLDIGTGTGLLALMAAQRNPNARIDAVELDEQAAQQAADNVQASPFANRIQVYRQAIQVFSPAYTYSHILTNPPFYTNHLTSPDAAVNRALHTAELPTTDLLNAVARLLNPNGDWSVLLPPYQMEQLTRQAVPYRLYPVRRLGLRHKPQQAVFRVLTAFRQTQTNVSEAELVIYEADGRTYTSDFRQLLRDFYLLF